VENTAKNNAENIAENAAPAPGEDASERKK
jgi:hypothetical protein